MPSNLPERDRDISDVAIIRDIPQEDVYTTPRGVHKMLQDWLERVRLVSRIDLLVAISEGVLISCLIQQADAPNTNNFQKILAIWLLIHRTSVSAIFQSEMRKREAVGITQISQKGWHFISPSALIEASSLLTAIAFQQSISALNKGPVVPYIIYPIMSIEFLSPFLRIILRVKLDDQALAIINAHNKAKTTEDGLPQQMVSKGQL